MTTTTDLTSPVVSAAMGAAAAATGMEVVFIGGLTPDTFTFQRVHGEWPGLSEGLTLERATTFCARMLGGAPSATSDAALDAAYVGVESATRFGIRSYVGVPIYRDDGSLIGTLCAVDRRSVPVTSDVLAVLRQLAAVIAAHAVDTAPGVVIRRTPQGWQVAGADVETDLTSAMALGDLLATQGPPPGRPQRPAGELSELEQLRLSVAQLEHALAARVLVEQAIGVLAERQRVAPRTAFERLRKAARSRGRRVHDLAQEVVASANSSAVPLPPELAVRRR
jgi:hypothetical protein